MAIKSEIYISDKIENTKRKFGEDKFYYGGYVVFPSGIKKAALFTAEAIQTAMDRAAKQTEDIDPEAPDFFEKMFDF